MKSPILVVLAADPGKTTKHLALICHRGGGWYDVQCMGSAKRCVAGECQHTRDMGFAGSSRRIRQVARGSLS